MIIAYEPELWTWRVKWDTSIIPGYGGLEQRSALEQIPAMEYEAEFILDVDDLRVVRTALFSGPTATHELALWQWETPVTVSAFNKIQLPKVAADAVNAVGRRLLLRKLGVTDQALTVSAVALVGDTYELTLGATITATGTATMLPLAEVYLRDNLQTGRNREDEIARWNMTAVSKTRYAVLGGGGGDIPEYDGYLLLPLPSSIEDEGQLQEQHQAAVGGLDDEGDSAPLPITGMTFGNISREARMSWHTMLARQFLLGFLYVVQGRRRPFLHPTWRPDITLERPVLAATGSLLVSDSPNFALWWAAESHKRLALMFDDGTFESVTVDEVVDNLNGTLSLNLVTPMVSTDEPVFVSHLEVVRLANDAIEIQLDHGDGHFDLPVVVVQTTPPA